MEAPAADAALAKAFGWRGQTFWRQERVRDPPCPEQVQQVLGWLGAELGIAEAADVRALLTVFPETLGLRVEALGSAVATLRTQWHLKGSVLTNAVKRKPRVLGNNFDCEVGWGRVGWSGVGWGGAGRGGAGRGGVGWGG